MGRLLVILVMFFGFLTPKLEGQEIYVVNSLNEIKIIDTADFSVSDLFAIDLFEFGYITDLAFAPDGTLYGVTNARTIIEIDLATQSAQLVANLPEGGTYTSLICNAQNELLTSKYLQQELYSYNLDSGETTFLAGYISSPGDFTYFKGNLIYPNIFNDFIKAWDGTQLYNVGCSVPLLYTFVNVYEGCNQQTVYGIDENAVIYHYDLENDTREVVAELLDQTGQLFGGASLNEYLASQCPLVILDEIVCSLSAGRQEIKELELLRSIVTDELVFRTKPNRNLHFQIRNTAGQLIISGTLDGRMIDVSTLASGLYFIWLDNPQDNGTMINKFIKQ